MAKKAQLKIQQMAFMLMAITVFFILAGMFALTIKYSDMRKDAEIMREQNAVLLASKVANSPEFSCGKAFGGEEIDCVDADKAMILSKNSQKYKNFWDVENIEIIKIPFEFNGKVCTSSNYPDCDIIQIINKSLKGTDASNFVSLCRKEAFEGESEDRCDVAKLVVIYNLQ